MAGVQKHVVGSLLHSLQISGMEGSVGLDEIHVFQELNDRALYLVWSAELFKFLPTSYSFPTYLDRRGIREGLLYCFCPRLTSSLALGHWSLRIGLVVSDLFSYHKRWGLFISSFPFPFFIFQLDFVPFSQHRNRGHKMAWVQPGTFLVV